MRTFVNLTPHIVRLNNGTEFPSAGTARVATTYSRFDDDLVADVRFGLIEGLPARRPDTIYIVSAIVAQAAAAVGRFDLVSPATGHPDCVRKDGQVYSVPGFVRPV